MSWGSGRDIVVEVEASAGAVDEDNQSVTGMMAPSEGAMSMGV